MKFIIVWVAHQIAHEHVPRGLVVTCLHRGGALYIAKRAQLFDFGLLEPIQGNGTGFICVASWAISLFIFVASSSAARQNVGWTLKAIEIIAANFAKAVFIFRSVCGMKRLLVPG